MFSLFFLIVTSISNTALSDYKDIFINKIVIDDTITLSSIKDNITNVQFIEDEEIEVITPLVPKFENRESKKRIYLYNTHQTESYSDDITTYDITLQLAKMLKDKGFDVVMETSDFMTELNENNMNYNQLYSISRKYLNEAFVNYGGFDLVIDVHRDSAPLSATYLEANNKEYAKLMFVVGNKSKNAVFVNNQSVTYTDKMNELVPGIMRNVFYRESVYNQDMFKDMLLLEVGADKNSSVQALNSLEVLVEMLDNEMR